MQKKKEGLGQRRQTNTKKEVVGEYEIEVKNVGLGKRRKKKTKIEEVGKRIKRKDVGQ